MTLGLETGGIALERVFTAPTKGNRTLAEIFETTEQIERWQELVEKCLTADDTFAAFRANVQTQVQRFRLLDRVSDQLDEELAEMLARRSGPPARGARALQPGRAEILRLLVAAARAVADGDTTVFEDRE